MEHRSVGSLHKHASHCQHEGSYRTNTNFAAETAVDEIAHMLGKDPVEFRLNNIAEKFQDQKVFTNNSMRNCLLHGVAAIDWSGKWSRPVNISEISRSETSLKGMGVAMGTWHSLMGRGEAIVKAKDNGSIDVCVGVVDIGTGSKSTMAMIAANSLGVSFSDIRVVWGDTDICPPSVGESASRATTYTGYAVRELHGI